MHYIDKHMFCAVRNEFFKSCVHSKCLRNTQFNVKQKTVDPFARDIIKYVLKRRLKLN